MKKVLIILLVFFQVQAFCQDSVLNKKQLNYSGYVKDLIWFRFDKSFQNVYATNLVHNRMNIKWNPSQKISGRLEIRNRLYWGDEVRIIPDFKEQLNNQNEALNLSARWWSNRSTVLHSNIERLWMEYRQGKWNIRAGRQRINWGVTNTWNPNDIFNAYNFLDFDYEERPGSDAVKTQYLLSDLSNIEFAFSKTDEHSIAAAKYATHYKKYDLQAIAGVYEKLFTAGIGWAGSISDVGFKGEAQFYADQKDSASFITSTLEADYIFKNGWYLSSAILYNQKGLDAPLGEETNIVFKASPRNLMPARWNMILNSAKEFTPRFNGSMNIVYAPQVNLVILFPSLRYNLKPNLDLDFVWQSFFAEMKKFQALSHTGFFRVKWSF